MEELDAILNDIDTGVIKKVKTVQETENTSVKTEAIVSQKQMVDVQEEFLINRDAEETKLTLEYARRIIALEMEVKAIKDDMAAIKKEYKDDGVSVGKVNKAIRNIKMAAKLNDLDATEIEMIQTVLSADVDIRTEIALLIKKAD